MFSLHSSLTQSLHHTGGSDAAGRANAIVPRGARGLAAATQRDRSRGRFLSHALSHSAAQVRFICYIYLHKNIVFVVLIDTWSHLFSFENNV